MEYKFDNGMTLTEDQYHKVMASYKLHHSSLAKGYQSAKVTTVEDYNGRFGSGLKVHEHNSRTSKYHWVSYYIAKEYDEC